METGIESEMAEHISNGTQPHSNLDKLCSLLRNELPDARQTLLDTQSNLEKVADYCSSAYLDVINFNLTLIY